MTSEGDTWYIRNRDLKTFIYTTYWRCKRDSFERNSVYTDVTGHLKKDI